MYYGSEFIFKALDKWAHENKIALDFSRPGKQTYNALIKSFNGSFWDECLNTHWFLSLDNAAKRSKNGIGIIINIGFTLPWVTAPAEKFAKTTSQSRKSLLLAGTVNEGDSNAASSVLGSIATIILAISFGFTQPFLLVPHAI
jgi:hypothetical protein